MMTERLTGILAAILLTIFLFTGTTVRVFAAPGDLDTTFGNGGKMISDLGYPNEGTSEMAILPDGRIVVASERQLAIFSAESVLQQTFGETGDTYSGLAVQSDGKIVTVGNSFRLAHGCWVHRVNVRRFNTDGAPDTVFGTGSGLTSYSAGCAEDGIWAQAYAITLYGGKIIVAGSLENGTETKFLTLRLSSNGTFDTSFNQDGIGIYSVGSDGEAYDVSVQPRSGRIALAGGSLSGSELDSALLVLTANGYPDLNFGDFGTILSDLGGNDLFQTVAFRADGKIVAGGYNTSPGKGTVARYSVNGTLDAGFSGNGVFTTEISLAGEQVADVLIQPDGKILVASSGNLVYFGDTRDFILYRLNAEGSYDSTFGGAGIVTTDFAQGWDYSTSMVKQPDGKIIVAGRTSNENNSDIALARYMP